MDIFKEKYDSLQALCKINKVKRLFVFGSVLRADFNDDSDIDFLVDINESEPLAYSDLYFNLKFALEDLFNRSIDLLEEPALRNQFLRTEIDATKVLIYG